MEKNISEKNKTGNRLILGDNLQVLKDIPSESVDLCYIDPPFFSNRNYEVIWGDKGEVAFFSDKWSGGIDHYIGWLKERIEEIWRVLKKTGGLYVHCDWHADAYIRVYILDKLCGKFMNGIAWCYGSGGASREHFSKKHDTIFLYTKSKKHIFNTDAVREPYSSPEKSATPKRSGNKEYIKMHPLGRIPFDWWQIPILTNSSNERIGYPTQKPLALMERIIKASSNEGDVVLDAFCGSGTTLVAAQKLNRRFIGIDQSVRAITVSRERLENNGNGNSTSRH
jgi:DNA modification methylase